MRARDYDPATGRFTATDPVAIPTGMAYFSSYSYSFSNPLRFNDVTGFWPIGSGDSVSGSTRGDAVDTSRARRGSNISYGLLRSWMWSSDATALASIGSTNPARLNAQLSNAACENQFGRIIGGLNALTSYEDAQATAALYTMRQNFRPGGNWDLKVSLRRYLSIQTERAGWLTMTDGRELYYDVFGNLLYGYMCAVFALDEDLAVAASHASGAGNPDPADDVAVRLGYELAGQRGGHFSENQFYDFIVGHSAKLVAVERIRTHR